jgi:hypothetical protein
MAGQERQFEGARDCDASAGAFSEDDQERVNALHHIDLTFALAELTRPIRDESAERIREIEGQRKQAYMTLKE